MNDFESQKAQTDNSNPSQIPFESATKPLARTHQVTEIKDAPKARNEKKGQPKVNGESPSGFASDIHKYIRDQIQLADQKAGFLFAAVTTMLAFLHARGVTKLWLKNPRQWFLSDVLSFAAITGLVLGAALAVFVILPRLRGAPRGLVFWKSITLFENAKDYAQEVLARTPSGLTTAKLEHCYELAKVCRQKYRFLCFALWSGSFGLVASIIYLVAC